jgi:hypothetical protein
LTKTIPHGFATEMGRSPADRVLQAHEKGADAQGQMSVRAKIWRQGHPNLFDCNQFEALSEVIKRLATDLGLPRPHNPSPSLILTIE